MCVISLYERLHRSCELLQAVVEVAADADAEAVVLTPATANEEVVEKADPPYPLPSCGIECTVPASAAVAVKNAYNEGIMLAAIYVREKKGMLIS